MGGIGQPRKLELNLALAMTDREFNISGTQFGIWYSPLASDEIQVRFNSNSQEQILFRRTMILAVPFTKVYITVPAGMTGTMTLLYGHGSMDLFRIFPNVPEPFTSMETLLTDMLAQLEGPLVTIGYGETAVGVAALLLAAGNADRTSLTIQAKWNNAGIIYLGYTNAVTAANWGVCLSAGEAYTFDNYRGNVYGIASLAAQNIGFWQW